MTDIKNILVPYDFSTRCRAAAAHAVLLSDRLGAPITLIHVIPYSSFEYAAFEGGAYVGTVWPSEDDVVSSLRAEVDKIEAPGQDKSAWGIEVLKGEPPLRITEFAAQVESPLVVMPTHGHGVFRRFVLGSVTAKTLHDLSCPILTGGHLEDRMPFSDAYQRVACAVDLTDDSLATLRFAADFAKVWEADLSVVHASTWLSGVEADEAMLPPIMRTRLLDTARGEVAALIREVGCEAEVKVDFGQVTEYVTKIVGALNADILVTGRRKKDGGGRLGAHSYELIRSAPCPVLSV